MKLFLVTEAFLDEANFGDTVWWSIPELAIPAGLQEFPPNARVLTLEAILSANAKHGGGTPTVGLMRALEELFREDDK